MFFFFRHSFNLLTNTWRQDSIVLNFLLYFSNVLSPPAKGLCPLAHHLPSCFDNPSLLIYMIIIPNLQSCVLQFLAIFCMPAYIIIRFFIFHSNTGEICIKTIHALIFFWISLEYFFVFVDEIFFIFHFAPNPFCAAILNSISQIACVNIVFVRARALEFNNSCPSSCFFHYFFFFFLPHSPTHLRKYQRNYLCGKFLLFSLALFVVCSSSLKLYKLFSLLFLEFSNTLSLSVFLRVFLISRH